MNLNNLNDVKVSNNFTKDQQNAIDNIISFIAAPFDPANYIVGLIGAGGTGKTYITKYIISHCKYGNSVIICASPTHKACRVFSQSIGGKEVNTIQSVFGLRLDLRLEDFNPINPQFNPMVPPKIDNAKLLIIDESSMLPAKLVTYICDKCKEKEIKIIFIGDKYQLAPVNERKSIAFDRCSNKYELTEIVRQATDNPISKLLPILRNDISNKSFNFLTYLSNNIGISNYNEIGEGFSICSKSNFLTMVNNSFSDENYRQNIDLYRIIAYTNNRVAGWNNYIRNLIIKDSKSSIITKNDLIMSYTTIVNDFMETVINNSEEYIINDIVDYVDDKYSFKGFLIKFQLIHGGTITKPLFVLDSTDRYTILKYHKTITELVNTAKKSVNTSRVTAWKNYYNFKKNYILPTNIINSNGSMLFSRDIDYGFSITAHKSQGSTYNTVFVDVMDMVYSSNGKPYTDINDMLRRLYVACSRAKKELILCYGR